MIENFARPDRFAHSHFEVLRILRSNGPKMYLFIAPSRMASRLGRNSSS